MIFFFKCKSDGCKKLGNTEIRDEIELTPMFLYELEDKSEVITVARSHATSVK